MGKEKKVIANSSFSGRQGTQVHRELSIARSTTDRAGDGDEISYVNEVRRLEK